MGSGKLTQQHRNVLTLFNQLIIYKCVHAPKDITDVHLDSGTCARNWSYNREIKISSKGSRDQRSKCVIMNTSYFSSINILYCI